MMNPPQEDKRECERKVVRFFHARRAAATKSGDTTEAQTILCEARGNWRLANRLLVRDFRIDSYLAS
jgi:hypothetical protein